jgi:hypothetical protein
MHRDEIKIKQNIVHYSNLTRESYSRISSDQICLYSFRRDLFHENFYQVFKYDT